MQKRNRIFALLLSVALLLPCLALGETSPLEISFYFPVNVGGTVANLIEQLTADFNAENPDVVVTPIYTGNYDDTVVKLQTAIQAGNPPDFFVSLATQRFSMVSMGAVIALDDLIAQDGGTEYINDFLPGFMEDSFVDGKIWSIPFQRSTLVMYYNKDAFREVGLDPEAPPKNWEELIQYAQKLTKKDANGNVTRWGVGIPIAGGGQWCFTGFCLENSLNGENLMTDDGKAVLFDTPENVEALQLWIDLSQKYDCQPEGLVQWSDLPGQFMEGTMAMIYHTTGNLTNIANNSNVDFGVCYMPAGRQYGAPTGGGNFYISSGISPERQQAAWRFIRFATSTERAAQWSVDTGYVATRKSSFESETLKNFYAKLPQARVAVDQIEYAKPELTIYEASKVWSILNNWLQAAWTGEVSAQEALTSAQEEATEVLQKYQ